MESRHQVDFYSKELGIFFSTRIFRISTLQDFFFQLSRHQKIFDPSSFSSKSWRWVCRLLQRSATPTKVRLMGESKSRGGNWSVELLWKKNDRRCRFWVEARLTKSSWTAAAGNKDVGVKVVLKSPFSIFSAKTFKTFSSISEILYLVSFKDGLTQLLQKQLGWFFGVVCFALSKTKKWFLLYNKFYFTPFRSLSSTAVGWNQKTDFFLLLVRTIRFFFEAEILNFFLNRVSAAEAPFKFLRGSKFSSDTVWVVFFKLHRFNDGTFFRGN